MPIPELSLFRFVDTFNEPLSWPIDIFCRLVFSEMEVLQDRLTVQVTEIRHYKEKDGLEHEFLIVGVTHGGKHHMLRIERSTPSRVRRTFWQGLKQTSSSVLPALDTVSISSSFKKLTANMNRGPIIHIATLPISSNIINLYDFCLLLSLFPSFSPIYKLKEEQCYWFCNVILATISSMGNLTLTREEGFERAGKYGRFSINVSAKARQLFIDGYQIIRRLRYEPDDELGHIELTHGIAQTLVAMLTVQSDEAKTQALTSITYLASSSVNSRQILLDAGSADQLRLIFLPSPVELKALIFLAFDALDLPDFNVFPDVERIYEMENMATADMFTEEDRNALDLQYAKGLRDLIDLFEDVRPIVRSRSKKIFLGHANCRLFILDTIPHMAASSMSEVRLSIFMAIVELAQYPYLHVSIPESIMQVFPVLMSDLSGDVRLASIASLRKLTSVVQFRRPCITIFPLISLLFLGHSSDHMVSKLKELYCDGSIVSVETAVAGALADFKLDNVYLVGLKAVSEAAKYSICHPIIMETLPQVIGLLADESWQIRQTAVDLLSYLTPFPEFRLHVREAIPKVFGLLRDDDTDVQHSTIKFITKVSADIANFHSTIREALPKVISLLADISWQIHQAVVDSLSGLITLSESQTHVKKVILEVFDLLRDGNCDVRRSTVGYTTKATLSSKFRSTILELFPQIIGLLAEEPRIVRHRAILLLSSLVAHTEFRPRIGETIPLAIDLLKDGNWGVQKVAIEFLKQAVPYFDRNPAVIGAMPQVIRLLSDICWLGDISNNAADLLCDLMTYPDLRPCVQNGMLEVRKLVKSQYPHMAESVKTVLEREFEYGIS